MKTKQMLQDIREASKNLDQETLDELDAIVVEEFQKAILENTKPLDPEAQQILEDAFWDLV